MVPWYREALSNGRITYDLVTNRIRDLVKHNAFREASRNVAATKKVLRLFSSVILAAVDEKRTYQLEASLLFPSEA